MGPKYSVATNKEEKEKNKEINRELALHKQQIDRELKLLLLGTGESGKSTFLKQMKMIYGHGFTALDIINYKDLIYTNVVRGMQDLINAVRSDPAMPQISPANNAYCTHILGMKILHEHKFSALDADSIRAVWADEATKQCWQRRHLYQIYANTDLFFSDIDRVSAWDYQPTDTDILKLRMPTTGIVETVFELESIKFRVVDVGGQRSERKKWVLCFTDVTVVLFVVALSEFDQDLYEERKQNRIQESLQLFDEMINNEQFKNTAVILFLNKEDLLREKLGKGHSLAKAFPEYTGGQDYDNVTTYVRDQFLKLNRNSKRDIFSKITNATDKTNMKYVFDAVTAVILNSRIAAQGIL